MNKKEKLREFDRKHTELMYSDTITKGGRNYGKSFHDDYNRALQEAINEFLQSEEGQQAIKGQTVSFEINVRGQDLNVTTKL